MTPEKTTGELRTYDTWKKLVGIRYRILDNRKLVSPSPSCQWGLLLGQSKFINNQQLYLSQQTDGSVPNSLVVARFHILRANNMAFHNVHKFDEEGHSLKVYKNIPHPGKVTRIRELPQNKHIIATHTDGPEVFIWNTEAQPNCFDNHEDAKPHPDLVLRGHVDNAEVALAMCRTEPYVLSGGKDKYVVVWSILDHVGTLSVHGPRGIFQGHTDTVKDVQFRPTSTQEFCSVGDDSCMILWDARVGTSPISKVEKAHNAAVHCVDWNPHDENLILTGSADHSVCMFDRRKLTSNGVGSPLLKFVEHKAPVLCVQWCPHESSVFGSSAEDACINIWDHEMVGKHGARDAASGLFFKHYGHRANVTDFHWNLYEPWTIASVSEDGGGTLQIWRPIDLRKGSRKKSVNRVRRLLRLML